MVFWVKMVDWTTHFNFAPLYNAAKIWERRFSLKGTNPYEREYNTIQEQYNFGIWRADWRHMYYYHTKHSRMHDWMLSTKNIYLFPDLAPRMPGAWPFPSRQQIGRFFSAKHNQPSRKDLKILASGVHQQTTHPDHLRVSFKVNKPQKRSQSNPVRFSASHSYS